MVDMKKTKVANNVRRVVVCWFMVVRRQAVRVCVRGGPAYL